MQITYRCMGCHHKCSVEEHMRNLTQEKLYMNGVEHTMTVILCDTCKPEFDRISQENNDTPDFDALSTLAAMEVERAIQ